WHAASSWRHTFELWRLVRPTCTVRCSPLSKRSIAHASGRHDERWQSRSTLVYETCDCGVGGSSFGGSAGSMNLKYVLTEYWEPQNALSSFAVLPVTGEGSGASWASTALVPLPAWRPRRNGSATWYLPAPAPRGFAAFSA